MSDVRSLYDEGFLRVTMYDEKARPSNYEVTNQGRLAVIEE